MIFRPKSINPLFISYALLSKFILYDQLYLLRMRAAQPHLNAEELGETIVLKPDIDEQIKIATFIKENDITISKAISLKQNEMEKLKEYKTSLIDSVVTGKVRIR